MLNVKRFEHGQTLLAPKDSGHSILEKTRYSRNQTQHFQYPYHEACLKAKSTLIPRKCQQWSRYSSIGVESGGEKCSLCISTTRQ